MSSTEILCMSGWPPGLGSQPHTLRFWRKWMSQFSVRRLSDRSDRRSDRSALKLLTVNGLSDRSGCLSNRLDSSSSDSHLQQNPDSGFFTLSFQLPYTSSPFTSIHHIYIQNHKNTSISNHPSSNRAIDLPNEKLIHQWPRIHKHKLKGRSKHHLNIHYRIKDNKHAFYVK